MDAQPKNARNSLIAASVGTVLVAICCFTPILVITLGAIGLSALTPYLDFVLLPALIVMTILMISSYIRWRKSVR